MVLEKLRKIFVPISMVMILGGIIALIQPVQLEIFRWGFNVLWVGLVAYIIFSHF
jgi:hypothetical protein